MTHSLVLFDTNTVSVILYHSRIGTVSPWLPAVDMRLSVLHVGLAQLLS